MSGPLFCLHLVHVQERTHAKAHSWWDTHSCSRFLAIATVVTRQENAAVCQQRSRSRRVLSLANVDVNNDKCSRLDLAHFSGGRKWIQQSQGYTQCILAEKTLSINITVFVYSTRLGAFTAQHLSHLVFKVAKSHPERQPRCRVIRLNARETWCHFSKTPGEKRTDTFQITAHKFKSKRPRFTVRNRRHQLWQT